jgi:uncharacterized protein YndB with AHSA1/START domain
MENNSSLDQELSKNFIAKTSITIDAPVVKVWNAFVNPKMIKQYMFGTDVITDWTAGSSIIWKGEWQGKQYVDKGTILKIEEERLIQYNHYSPLSGIPDIPENYHTITVELSNKGRQTIVSLSQDNNTNEQTREHSEKNWKMMLESLKKLLEKSSLNNI